MLKVSIGHSEELDSGDAIDEVLNQCHKTLEGIAAQCRLTFHRYRS